MKDKLIVITGAASGMGLATAKLLATKGCRLSLADVQAEALDAAAAEINALSSSSSSSSSSPAQAIGTVVDVRDRAACDAWIRRTVEHFGGGEGASSTEEEGRRIIDGAANLAGVIGRKQNHMSIADMTDDEWDWCMGINGKGLLNCMAAQIPYMRDREGGATPGVGKGGSSIVNAASVAGLMGFKNNGAYVASKHVVVGLTKTAAKELGGRGVRVNCFCPGPIETPMLAQSAGIRGKEMDLSHIALNRKGSPEEVATLVEFLLGEGSTFMTGGVLHIDGGWVC